MDLEVRERGLLLGKRERDFGERRGQGSVFPVFEMGRLSSVLVRRTHEIRNSGVK